MHERRPLLELRPLVVDGLEGDADVDVLLDRHAPPFADALDALGLLCLASASGQHAFAGLLGHASRTTRLVDLLADRLLHGSTKLLPGLLERGGTVAAKSLAVFPYATRCERRKGCYAHAGGKALRA